VSLDFILGDQKIQKRRASILVVIDRFFKMAHFIMCPKPSDASYVAVFFYHVVKLYGLPKTMVFDKDVKFVSYFWQTLWHKMRTKLKFLTAYTQADGKSRLSIRH